MKILTVTLSLAAAVWGLSRREQLPFELQVVRGSATGECDVITFRKTQIIRGLGSGAAHVTSLRTVSGDDKLSIVSYDEEALWTQATSLCKHGEWMRSSVGRDMGNVHGVAGQEVFSETSLSHAYPPLEIFPLSKSGSSSNRVDLVFFSDGYLLGDKPKFLEDAKRLADDISNNHTFDTVKPLLNFWAAFSPSNERGVGSDGKPNDTPFGLYRDGTELRAVYYSKPDAARAACLVMGTRCDFPILMGNDPLYGGLGGEFTVITPSLANGALVLRHELGHSVVDVGEEYDGGYDYFGVNAFHDLHEPVSWSHWLTDPPSAQSRSHSDQHIKPRVERSVMPMQEYPWTLLNTTTPWSTTFNASGMYARHLVRFSLSGLPDARDLAVELDGVDLGWTPRKDIGIDRWHYDIHREGALGDGEHKVEFTLKNGKQQGIAQLCSVEILEFGTEDEFVAKPGHYSLFPTFSDKNETSYRPTNEDCLMRIVTTPDFCKVCTEGLWYALLKRVDLIDDVDDTCAHDATTGKWTRSLGVQLLPLGQFRSPAVSHAESYTITWSKDGKVLDAFTNKTHLSVDDEDSLGVYTVNVAFSTEEVRVDKDGLLSSSEGFVVGSYCNSRASDH